MKDLWYYEQRNMGGGWSPCTSENRPTIKTVNGNHRIAGSDGAVGPRIRRVTQVPTHLQSLSLKDLQAELNKD